MVPGLWNKTNLHVLFIHTGRIYISCGIDRNALLYYYSAGPTFIKPDDIDPLIKDQMKITPVNNFAATVSKL